MLRWLLNDITEIAAIFVFSVGLVVLSGLVYYRMPGPLQEERTVFIEPGTGASAIAAQLVREGVIRPPEQFFLAALSLTDQRHLLKAGEYEFLPRERMISVVRKLVAGQVVIHRFTLVEGGTSYEALSALKNEPLLTGELPESVPEGTLFPDTYFFNRGDTRVSVLEKMRKAMDANLQKAWLSRKDRLPPQIKSPQDILILASMIEKETSKKEERERVAGVFVNRLNNNMRLESDPTVVYALTLGQRPLGRSLTLNDLKNTNSPYNTYLVSGLPAGPICNPGLASLKAAAYPEENSFFYFVADGYGGHRFANNLAEHNRNVVEWRRISRLLKERGEDVNLDGRVR